MTGTAMNLTNPYRGERRAGTVGLPFPGQEARVVDLKTRLPLPADSDGEIEVRGPHVFAGYWRQPSFTAACFDRDGWFRTGDLGRVSADGYVTITGRLRSLSSAAALMCTRVRSKRCWRSAPACARWPCSDYPIPTLASG